MNEGFMNMNMNGKRTESSPDGSTIFVTLPVALWRRTVFACQCAVCKAENRTVCYWDTLAVSTKRGANNSWMVHKPEMYISADRDAADRLG